MVTLPYHITINQVGSQTPIAFHTETSPETDDPENASITMQQLIDEYAPEFSQDAKGSLYKPLLHGNLQTAYTALNFDNVHLVHFHRHMLHYQDGGVGALDIAVSPDAFHKEVDHSYIPETQQPFPEPFDQFYSYVQPDHPSLSSDDEKPMMIILHGVTGGSWASYGRPLILEMMSKYGFECCVLNNRGCNYSKITTPQLYNGGWTNDVRYMVTELRDMYPNRKFYMVGFSLGATILVNYLGEEGDKSDIECAVALGNPWDMVHSTFFVNHTFVGSRIYAPTVAKNLAKISQNHLGVLIRDKRLKPIYETKLFNFKNFEEFDDQLTAPMFGYNTANEYYRDASSVNRLMGVRTPILALNSMDDPVIGADFLPEKEIILNPYILLLETSIGGHVAWFSDAYGNRWYTKPIGKYLNAFHTQITMKGLKPDLSNISLPINNSKPVKTTYNL
ncbi:putative carboxylic ester hydrolase NDAI_0K01060 [Naumovozyma dairenensis CBS 421]|uniref:AB hydrolase-1 domain-containing protein n=1 Tax=Naumovozyma dairenensis (strain ATCC 10597 / BCRC 20456 / CBS 421 / NBRC 0211 / NRRL Y-12639) TaxID=1071378 RepID=G0WHN6_NAUDC|nr:hypothetical protein NDAI_0K01060 [Naumovozyma dairenensis CBS 421]CCD27297.1 hypothetical protein NDAI_0K01060 [Naumovozyma dairenensis CBS 421]